MQCTPMSLPNGGHAIVCTSVRRHAHRCAVCGAPSEFQCDRPVAKTATCDAHVCAAHAAVLAPNTHYCHKCQRETGARTSAFALPTPVVGQELKLRGRKYVVRRLEKSKAHLVPEPCFVSREIPMHRLRVLMREAGY